MTGSGLLQVALYLLVLVALVKPLGAYMARVFEGERTFLTPVVGPVERLIYRLAGIDPSAETDWRQYALAVLVVNLVGFVVVYALQRMQGFLPLNPQDFPGVSPDSSFNTAVSFASNTNWQGYGGEMTMSYLTQSLGLGVQNFLSAATGIAVLVALTRGLIRRETDRIGNFWIDFTRTTPTHYLLEVAPLWEAEYQIEASAPTAKEARLLGIGPGDPCLVVVRRTMSRNVPITLARLVHPGSRYQLEGAFSP